MSIRNPNKDHLTERGGVGLVESSWAPVSDDPLRFWTSHPTENTLIDLRVFAEGERANPNPTGGGIWSGPFSGRPELIAELATAVQARLTLAPQWTCTGYKAALRAFWRVCDQLEAKSTSDGRSVEPLSSVRNLTHLHEAAMHRAVCDPARFGMLLNLLNDARRLLRLGSLLWTVPSAVKPRRKLIPDDQAKTLKLAIKKDWEQVRKGWARNDAIMRGEEPDTLGELQMQDATTAHQYTEQNELLRCNWLHFKHIQKTTGRIVPTVDQLFDDNSIRNKFRYHQGITPSIMRGIAFPSVEEADIAFHSALIGSGWNPSTLIAGIDATLPELIFQHPKDQQQSVLVIELPKDGVEHIEEITMQGNKRRAGGRLQFCMGLKKNPNSPPVIVAAYLARTAALREQLRQDIQDAHTELARLRSEEAPKADVERQFKRLLTMQQGLRNIWLYLDKRGNINWLDGRRWGRYSDANKGGQHYDYLDRVIGRLNTERAIRNEPAIERVTPGDFRDIYARWVYKQSSGNIIAVMLALGHGSLRSTNAYVDNNIFSAENDEIVRNFMTHLFEELKRGRVDLTILAQLVGHGPLTPEMQARLEEYRRLMRSRVKAGCADPKHPPPHTSPDHVEGKWCGTQRCLRDCPHARFLPESLDGIAMRVEELIAMSDHLPLETWLQGEFQKELKSGEFLLVELYPEDAVAKACAHWREKIRTGMHVVPGVGIIREVEPV